MGYEVQFFMDGSVAVYCTCSDLLCPRRFLTLGHLQSYCGYLQKKWGDEDPRVQRDWYDWHDECVDEDEGDLTELGKRYQLTMTHVGKFSFDHLISDQAKTYLTQNYGYFK